MAHLVDTIVFIWAVRDLHGARALLGRLRAGQDLAVSAITLLELRRALSAEESASVEDHLRGVAVLAVDERVARAAGDYLTRCADEGHRVDFFAGIIAATAAASGRGLVTYSPAHYPLADCDVVPLEGT